MYTETELLIVGIDPGTTAGIAALDLNGSLVLLTSRKNIPKYRIIRIITGTGKPVVISTDMTSPPDTIEKISRSLGARLIHPETEMSRKDKLDLVKDFVKEQEFEENPWKNRHERDALASALHAWKQIRSLIMKINTKIGIYAVLPDFPELNAYVKSNVIIKGKSISKALEEYLGRKKPGS